MKKFLLIPLAMLLSLSLFACENDEEQDFVIYTTAYPIKFMLEEQTDGIADVRFVPGSQQHGESIDWAAQEIISMQDADFLVYVGGGLDPYIDANLASTFEGEDVTLIRLEEYIDFIEVDLIHDHDEDHDDEHDEDHDDDDFEEMPDAHFWLDPQRMIEASNVIYDYLLDHYDTELQQAIINNNNTVFQNQLDKLLDDHHQVLSSPNRPLITNVKLFTYYERAFDVEIYPFTLSAHAHEDESIPTDYEAFIELAEHYDIDYVVFEKNAASPAGETLLSELRNTRPHTERLELHPLERLSNDEVKQNSNYFTIMYDNLQSLEKAID